MPWSEADREAIREAAYALWERAGRPCGLETGFWLAAERDYRDYANQQSGRVSDVVQEASEESFPASDPPAWVPIVGVSRGDIGDPPDARPHDPGERLWAGDGLRRARRRPATHRGAT
jgi:hypothetical protein